LELGGIEPSYTFPESHIEFGDRIKAPVPQSPELISLHIAHHLLYTRLVARFSNSCGADESAEVVGKLLEGVVQLERGVGALGGDYRCCHVVWAQPANHTAKEIDRPLGGIDN
jgi:hypothetical protein